jgi:recombination protein RecA
MSLKEALQRIDKQFGKNSVMAFGDHTISNIESIPSGILSLDLIIGCGGIPKGRILEAFGTEGGGKTTLALTIAAQVQKAGLVAAYIDAEHSLSPDYAKTLGVDINKLLISQPDYGEQGLQIAEQLITSGEVGIVVVDSVASLTPKAEIDGEIGDNFMGLSGRMMSQAMRKLTAVTHQSQTILLFINQIREKIGVMFGSPETQPGGRALKFYSSVRIDVRRSQILKDGEENIGARTKIKLVKNKMGSPFQETEVDLIFGRGFSRYGDILDLAVNKTIVEKSGAWYIVNGEKLQGRQNAIEFLESNPGIADNLETEIRNKQ